MKVAVTGAGGYLGRHLAAALAARGHQVVPLSRRAPPPLVFDMENGVVPDLGGVDALVHAAWDFSPRGQAANARINLEGSRRLLAAARQSGVERLVFISTMSAFPGCRSVYGRTKRAVEDLFLAGGGRVLRPGLIWSARPGGMVATLDRLARLPVAPVIAGGGILYLSHADDVAALAARVAEAPADFPPVITAAHPQGWRMGAILAQRARAQGRHPLLLPVPWPLVWLGVRALESMMPRASLRSDSVIGLVHADPAPHFSAEANAMRVFA